MSAYPVPFTVDRRHVPRLRVRNSSAETLHWVRVEMAGRGVAHAPITPRLSPGEVFEVTVHGDELERDSRVILRWRRANGEEYLWGIAL